MPERRPSNQTRPHSTKFGLPRCRSTITAHPDSLGVSNCGGNRIPLPTNPEPPYAKGPGCPRPHAEARESRQGASGHTNPSHSTAPKYEPRSSRIRLRRGDAKLFTKTVVAPEPLGVGQVRSGHESAATTLSPLFSRNRKRSLADTIGPRRESARMRSDHPPLVDYKFLAQASCVVQAARDGRPLLEIVV